MITRWEVVCVLLVAAGIAVGWLLGHWRAYAECCDCCTCQTCTEGDSGESVEEMAYEDPDVTGTCDWGDCDEIAIGRRFASRIGWLPVCGRHLPESKRPTVIFERVDSGRRTVVLEPGPTIYPALAELAGEVMDEPHSHADDMDSTFVSRVLLSWESRYPIPQEA